VIVGNAGILVTRALYRKFGDAKNFIIVDAGMNDLMRPALYRAYHAIQPVVISDRQELVADVVGPICESSDYLAQDRKMAGVKNGDLLAVMSTGAYGFAMASNYCSRPKAAEVMVSGDQFHVITARQQYEDLVAGESVPPFLVT
jgi:diaminopimelate decarboxylase